MADVLRGVKRAVGQGRVERAQVDEPRRGHVAPAAAADEAGGDLVEARHAVRGQREALQRVAVLDDGEALVQRDELAADGAPDLLLVVVVVDRRRGLAGAPAQSGRGDLVAPAAVGGVAGAGVAGEQVHDDLAVVGGRHGGVELGLFEHGTSSLMPVASSSARRFTSLTSCTGQSRQVLRRDI